MKITQTVAALISLVIVFFFFLILYETVAFGQITENGVIGQTIGDTKTQFYVQDIKELKNSESSSVEIFIVFKNVGRSQQEFYPSSFRLVDSQSREYRPQSSLFLSSVNVPSEDTLAWKATFKIPSNNLSKIYYTGLSETRFTVDLTKKITPSHEPPQSSWNLSSNKGIKISSRQLEITINDERFEGKTYVIDATLKNVGKSSLSYQPSNFKVKDESSVPYPNNLFSKSLSPLLSGELPPGEQVRGDIEFDVDEPGKKMMIIYSAYSGAPFLNTGSAPVQNASAVTNNGTSVEIALGSSSPSNGEFYIPETLNVPKGASVLWTNLDNTLHTVTSGSPESGESGMEFDSSYLVGGKTFEWTFSDAGTFEYYCTLHPFKTGVVIVK